MKSMQEIKRTHMSAIEKRFSIYDVGENAAICQGSDYAAAHGEHTVSYRDIGTRRVEGFPIHIERRDGELYATFHPDTHAMIIGSTGSGKTTGFALPFLNWMPEKSNKPSVIISDPKNELNNATIERYRKNGYRIFQFNFQDYSISDCWNPLTKIYRCYQKHLHVEDEVELVIIDGVPYNSLDGILYKSQAELDKAVKAKKEDYLARVDEMIGSIATMLSPAFDERDPYWANAASIMIRGFLWAMLEDSHPDVKEGHITEQTYSFDTMLRIYESFANVSRSLDDRGYFTKRDPERSRAHQLVVSSIVKLDANVTRSCVVSIFSEKLTVLRDTSTRRITSAHTIDLDTLDNDPRPTAIFVSYRDEDSLHYKMIGMFISDLYTTLIDTARKKGGTLARPFYFLLDEFGNFPQFKDFSNVISACRSRNIWFLLILQSYAQLEHVYGKDTAAIIMDNLNMHIFYGSCNYETKRAFSEECGKHKLLSPLSAINGKSADIEHYEFCEVPLIPVSALSELKEGDCIITQMRGNVIYAHNERSYLCPEYNNGLGVPRNRFENSPFLEDRYQYDVSRFYRSESSSRHNFFDNERK